MMGTRKPLFAAVAACLGLAAGLALGEAGLRFFPPRASLQTIDAHGWKDVAALDGVPVWRAMLDDGQRCPGAGALEPRREVLILSDSILYGSALPGAESCGKFLESALNPPGARARYRVRNCGQPAFSFPAKHALARRLLPAVRPRVLFWGISPNEVARYTFVGGAAYEFGRFRRDAGGIPSIRPLPSWLVARLIRHSGLFRFLLPSLSSRIPEMELWKSYVDEDLPRLAETVRRAGVRLVFVFCPPLDRDFAASAREPFPSYPLIEAFARRHGIETVSLARELAGQDYLALRQDPCCHFNARGQKAIAAVLRRKVLEPASR